MINVANAARSTPGLFFPPAVMIETRCARHTPKVLSANLRRMGLPSSASIATTSAPASDSGVLVAIRSYRAVWLGNRRVIPNDPRIAVEIFERDVRTIALTLGVWAADAPCRGERRTKGGTYGFHVAKVAKNDLCAQFAESFRSFILSVSKRSNGVSFSSSCSTVSPPVAPAGSLYKKFLF